MKHIFLSRFQTKKKGAFTILFLLVLALSAGMITSCSTESKKAQTDVSGQEQTNPPGDAEPNPAPQVETPGAQDKPAGDTKPEEPGQQDTKPAATLSKTLSGEWELFTTDWTDYTPLEPSQTLLYTLAVPENWVDEGSVFVTEERKVAEVCPPVKLAEGQTLPKSFSFLDGGINGSLLREADITIGNFKGKVTVFETNPSGGDIDTWYPYTYYLQKDDTVFVMAFYALEKDNPDDGELYERILSTLKFGE